MIGIIGAMGIEIMLIKEAMTDISSETVAGSVFYKGKIGSHDVILSQSLIGKVNAALTATIMIIKFGCTKLINTGIAGAMPPLKSEDIVIADKIYHSDADVTALGYEYGEIPGLPKFFSSDSEMLKQFEEAIAHLGYTCQKATILSGDSFVTNGNVVSKFTELGPIAFEMEGAGIAQTAYRFTIPFLSIRYISDVVGSLNQLDDYAQFERDMAQYSAAILVEILSIMK